jgi:GT2 family glycosyltransferase
MPPLRVFGFGGSVKPSSKGKVSVAIVTCNSDRYIQRCLDAVLEQQGVGLDVVVVDNASTDRTPKILKNFRGRIRVLWNTRNVGFAEAQNRAIRSSTAQWVLTLNPDVLMLPGFIHELRDTAEADPAAGSVCGKLLSIGPGFQKLPEPRIDSTGIFFTPAMRHFDRGWHEPDQPRFDNIQYVFGASAAAGLFRRRMIEDVSIEGNFFDPDFFVYREDADVAWRAMLLGWRCIYTPSAVAYHVRTVTPANRRSLPSMINMHSVKNRFLMRLKNATGGIYRRYWLPMTLRDLAVFGATFFWEPGSLPAWWHLARCFPRALRQRREIMNRRRMSDEALAQWFSFDPATQPIHTPEGVESPPGALREAVALAGRTT